jgi:tyrosyl-tRNA synthetase
MLFRIDSRLFARFPTACVGLVVAYEVVNDHTHAAISKQLREAEAQARDRFAGRDVQSCPAVAPWHEAFAQLGMSANRFRISVEALTLRVLKGAPLPDLNPAVDLANSISLKYSLPLGAHNIDRLRGDIVVGPAGDGATFVPMGSSTPELVDCDEIVYAVDRDVCTRRWVWRESEHSKVTGVTRTVLFPIDGWAGVNDDDVRAAQGDLATGLQEWLGARVRTFFIDREHPEADISDDQIASKPRQADTGARPDQPIAVEGGFRMTGLAGRETATTSPTPTLTDDLNMAEPTAPRPRRWGKHDPISSLLHRATDQVIVREELEARLRKGDLLRVKLGIDPTSPYVHLGHAVVLRKLRAFQNLGHTICLVIGDFTAQIGDASDKTSMRQMLSEEEVYQNLTTYRKQISRILDESKVEWSYNADWLGPLRFKDVIGLAANFTVAQMLERENFAKRYTAGQSIGLQEFLYPLMQGFDSVALKCDVEVGGTDQLFNLIAGRTLQRAHGQQPQSVLTCPLLLGLDGRKMSKSFGNSIALDDSAKDMYGKAMSIPDEQILPYYELCTDVPLEDVDAISEALEAGENPMIAKKRLAYEITRLYHSYHSTAEAQEAFESEVQRRERPADIPTVQLDMAGTWSLADLVVAAGLAKSKGEARRKAGEGAIYIDDLRIADPQAAVEVRQGMVIKLGRHYRQLLLPI